MADQAKAVTKAASSKKGEAKAASKHPPTSEMVNAALKSLNERNGSSLHAIKKYISATYKVEVEKLSTFIKKYLKSAVANGKVKQTKGIGASGSFKLSAAGTEPKKSVAKKAKHVTGEEKTKAKKSPVKTKKLVAKSDEKKKAPAKAASPKKTATASKEKSTKPKAAAIKPKVPKPKTVAAPTKKVAPKTAVAPKKAAAPAKKAAPKKAAASSKK